MIGGGVKKVGRASQSASGVVLDLARGACGGGASPAAALAGAKNLKGADAGVAGDVEVARDG